MQVSKSLGRKKKVQNVVFHAQLYLQISDRTQFLCLKPNYIIFPSAAQIFSKGFLITDLSIKHKNTQMFWKGLVDLRNLKAPLYELIDIGQSDIQVYPHEQDKPIVGNQLNRVCFVTIKNLKKINKDKLNLICDKNGFQILAFDGKKNIFTVEIPHFTKYSFKDVVEQNNQKDGLNHQQGEHFESLNSNISSSQNRSLLREMQMRRNPSNTSLHIKNNKNAIFSTQSHQQIKYSGQNSQISGDRMKGIIATVGCNGAVSCSSNYKTHSIELNYLQEKKSRDILNIVLKIMLDEKQINYFILSTSTTFEVRRSLALYAICFKLHCCFFQFQRKDGQIVLGEIKKAPEQYQKPQYLKNWFQWVINQEKEFNLPDNEMIRGLCLRKGLQLSQKSLKFKRSDDAQFLSKIEDISFRLGEPSKQLSLQLHAISLKDMCYFNKLHWIIRFAVYIWYYSFVENNYTKIQQILSQKLYSDDRYNIQRHILLTFFQYPYQWKILSPSNENELPLWWLISNQCNEEEQKINKNNYKYKDYRYNLVYELVFGFVDAAVTINLVAYENGLTREEKNKIVSIFVRKYPNQSQTAAIADWGIYADLVNESRAIICYSNHNYLKSLQHFGECKQLSDNSQKLIKQMVQNEQIICGIHLKTVEKIKHLLQKLKTNMIKDEITYINISLGKQQISKQQITRMLQYCNKIPKQKIRRKMHRVVFEAMVKNKNLKNIIKRDANFYKQIYSIYIDPYYKLELKVIRQDL